MKEFIFISDASGLQRAAEVISREPILAIDTESNSLFAYKEQVCLLQISSRETDYLIDTMLLRDLSVLKPVFADPKIEKVFHGSDYDILCLSQDFGFEFAQIFDTMVAARILNYENLGLGSILSEKFGINLVKRFQKANWGERPLRAELLTYARLDTHYLIALREKLKEELISKEMLRLACEDFALLCHLDICAPLSDEERIWRINGFRDLTRQQAAVFKELFSYRENVAKALNRPLFKVFGDRTLLDIACACPVDREELSKILGMTPLQMQRHSANLLGAVKTGLSGQPPDYPKCKERPAYDPDFSLRLQQLQEWRKNTALKVGVRSDVVMPKKILQMIAGRKPVDMEELCIIMKETPYRYEKYGVEILRALRVK